MTTVILSGKSGPYEVLADRVNILAGRLSVPGNDDDNYDATDSEMHKLYKFWYLFVHSRAYVLDMNVFDSHLASCLASL